MLTKFCNGFLHNQLAGRSLLNYTTVQAAQAEATAYLKSLKGQLMLPLLLIQLVLILLLYVIKGVVMLLLHAGYSDCMLLLHGSELSLQALCLGLAITDLMPGKPENASMMLQRHSWI